MNNIIEKYIFKRIDPETEYWNRIIHDGIFGKINIDKTSEIFNKVIENVFVEKYDRRIVGILVDDPKYTDLHMTRHAYINSKVDQFSAKQFISTDSAEALRRCARKQTQNYRLVKDGYNSALKIDGHNNVSTYAPTREIIFNGQYELRIDQLQMLLFVIDPIFNMVKGKIPRIFTHANSYYDIATSCNLDIGIVDLIVFDIIKGERLFSISKLRNLKNVGQHHLLVELQDCIESLQLFHAVAKKAKVDTTIYQNLNRIPATSDLIETFSSCKDMVFVVKLM